MANAGTKEFRKNPHEYVEAGDGVWYERHCDECGMQKVYHTTARQVFWERTKTTLACLFLGVMLSCGIAVIDYFDHSETKTTEYERCKADHGQWARSDTGPDYCILDTK